MYEITSIQMHSSAYIIKIHKTGEQGDYLGVQGMHAHACVHPPPAQNSLDEGQGGISQPSGFCFMHVCLRLGRVLGHSSPTGARTVPKPVFGAPRILLGAWCPSVWRWR